MPNPSGCDKDSGSKVHVIMPGDVFHAAAPREKIIDIAKIGISDRAILAIKKDYGCAIIKSINKYGVLGFWLAVSCFLGKYFTLLILLKSEPESREWLCIPEPLRELYCPPSD